MGSALKKVLDSTGRAGQFMSLAIDDGNPLVPANLQPMDDQMEGPSEPHAFVANADKPGKCAVCGKTENNEVHVDDEGTPFAKSDEAGAPNNPGYQAPTGPPVKASMLMLAMGVNPFAKHKFQQKKSPAAGPKTATSVDDTAPTGNCAVCGKGANADVHSNADGNPIGATGGNMTGAEWTQTSHTETALGKIIRLAGKPPAVVTTNRPGAGSLPAEDYAGKHGSFPIDSDGAVADALRSLGRAGSDNYPPDVLKSRILAIAKRKGYKIPDSDQ